MQLSGLILRSRSVTPVPATACQSRSIIDQPEFLCRPQYAVGWVSALAPDVETERVVSMEMLIMKLIFCNSMITNDRVWVHFSARGLSHRSNRHALLLLVEKMGKDHARPYGDLRFRVRRR